MGEYKNVSSINEIKGILNELQKLYTKRNDDELEKFIGDKFSFTNGLVVLGSEINQWCHSKDEIISLFKSHWKTENNYWKQVNFKFEDAIVYANENVAWVVSIGNILNTISENDQLENTICKISEIIDREEISKEDALNVASKIARTLQQIEKGEDYVWPFRFTSVLIKEEASWKFHQMQFSFDAESWNYRYIDENYDKDVFEMSKVNLLEETKEIKEVLGVFQDGYIKRDLNYVDEYMEKVFLLDDELVVVGTDAEELCLGVDATRGIIESDWKYWGNFRFNAEDAIISVHGDVAYFTTKAILNRVVTAEETLRWIRNGAKYTLKSEEKLKDKLVEILWDTIDLLYESEKGEIYITPMRFSGVLVRYEGKWLIKHLQYSDYNKGMPSVRIAG